MFDQVKTLRRCTIFSAIPRGSENRYVVPERRMCGEAEEEARSGNGGTGMAMVPM